MLYSVESDSFYIMQIFLLSNQLYWLFAVNSIKLVYLLSLLKN